MTRSIRVFLALIFIVAGFGACIGADQVVLMFEQIGLGRWLRYAAGMAGMTGGFLLLLPSTVVLGSAIATALMLGALLIQACLSVGNPTPTFLLALIAAISLVQAQLEQPAPTRRRAHHV